MCNVYIVQLQSHSIKHYIEIFSLSIFFLITRGAGTYIRMLCFLLPLQLLDLSLLLFSWRLILFLLKHPF